MHETPDMESAPLTAVLQRVAGGEAGAEAELLALVYEQLRGLARARLSGEAAATLQPTELVHEAWLRLGGGGERTPQWESRRHFFGAAAQAMRQVLVQHARRKGADKRGGGGAPVELSSILDLAAEPVPETILALDEAIKGLRVEFPAEAEVVMLRFFAGLSIPETAAALTLSERSVQRHWQFARAWLYAAITGSA